jgi:hypothetical protein
MRTIIVMMSCFISNIIFGQTSATFDLTKDGVKSIILELDSMDAKVLYKKALKWVQESYKNPSEVLKANLENEKVRIEGYSSNAWYYKSLGVRQDYDMEYSFEIEFKDKKIRLTFTPGQFWTQGRKAFTYSAFYKSSGDIKPIYKDGEASLEQTMNDLKDSLIDYLNKKKDSDW